MKSEKSTLIYLIFVFIVLLVGVFIGPASSRVLSIIGLVFIGAAIAILLSQLIKNKKSKRKF